MTVYTRRYDFPTKKALKQAVEEGKEVIAFETWDDRNLDSCDTTIQGPQYPKPHRWYARVRVVDGRVVKVLS